MSINIGDNLSYRGSKFLNERDGFVTLAAMLAYPATDMPDGHVAYCAETKLYYKYDASAVPDETLGKWVLADAVEALRAISSISTALGLTNTELVTVSGAVDEHDTTLLSIANWQTGIEQTLQNITAGNISVGVEFIFKRSVAGSASTPASANLDGSVPDGWSSIPLGATLALPYELVSKRTKTNGTWGAWSTPSVFSRYTTDGTSAYVLDLSNDSCTIPATKDGLVTDYAQASTQARLYYGANQVTGATFQVTSITEGLTTSLANGLLSITNMALGLKTGQVTIAAAVNDVVVQVAKFNITKAIAGSDGENATIVYLATNATVIRRTKAGVVDISNLIVRVYSKTGSADPVLLTDKYVRYKRSDDNNWLVYEAGISVTNITTAVDIEVYTESGGTLLDSERIPVIEDGVDGKSIYTLDLTNDNATVPADKTGVVTNYDLAATAANLYLGSLLINNAVISVQSVTAGVLYDLTGNYFTVTYIPDNVDIVTATLVANVDGTNVESALFSLTKAKAGTDGTAATVYTLRTSASIVRRANDGIPDVSTITARGWKVTGTAPAEIASNAVVKYKRSTDSAWLTGTSIAIISGVQFIDIEMYIDNVLLDSEHIPVVVDGTVGQSTYMHIKYSSIENPTTVEDMQETPSTYIGVYTDFTEADSDDPTKYTWARLQGLQGGDGSQGIPGTNGIDGRTTYLHIKYSNDGTTFTPATGDKAIGETTGAYMGTYVDFLQNDSTNFADYTWKKIEGAQGVKGDTGTSLYTWIKYANDSIGTGISDDPTGKTYIGLAYNKTVATESTNAADYAWSKIEGTQGIQGAKGSDGTTYYTWIKYSDYSDGSNPYDVPTNATGYIGVAVNKTTATESIDPLQYTWSKFKGEQGVQGPAGAPKYTWIKYADDELGNGFTNDPTGKAYIGFAFNKDTAEESNNASDYTWSRIQGNTGVQGAKGSDGTTYYTWVKYSDNSDGTDLYDVPKNSTAYIGLAVNKTTATESNDKLQYVWSKFRGDQGIQGPTGVTLYTWIKYADDANGSGLSNDPAGKAYIGLALNKTTAVESEVASDYTWSKIQGIQGIAGDKGADGITYYTWVKYSDYADGTNMYDAPVATTAYIGLAVNKLTATEGSDKTAYTWSKFRGDQGVQGPTGVSLYTWVRYADDVTGLNISNDPTGKTYIGFAYNKTTATESSAPADYTWSKITGDDGDQGIAGTPGADGITYYTWVKYSDNSDGTGLYDTPVSTTGYIGIAVNKLTALESSNPADYTWSKFRGDQGVQGPAGNTYYTWIKYATDSIGTGISDDPTGKTYIGLAYNKTTAIESIDPTLYTWSAIKGEQGVDGPKGSDGTTYYTWIKYSDSADGSAMYDTPTANTAYIGIATNKTTPIEGTTASMYTWSKFRGEQGVAGPAGTTYYTWIRYSNYADGTDMYTTPTVSTLYIGIAVNQTSASPSANKTAYNWSKFRGDTGVAGTPGANGVTYYTWIKYADDVNGSGMSDDPTGKLYIGIATNKLTATEGSEPSEYMWAKFKGEQGIQGLQGIQGPQGNQGIQGPVGATGATPYFHIKYADIQNPTSAEQISETPSTYIGTYVDYVAEDSTNPATYSWARFQGMQGEQGIAGPNGDDGLTYYLHIKYSNDGGTTLTDNNGETAGEYIGVYTDTTELDSSDVTKYKWTKVKGEQGEAATIYQTKWYQNGYPIQSIPCDSNGNPTSTELITAKLFKIAGTTMTQITGIIVEFKAYNKYGALVDEFVTPSTQDAYSFYATNTNALVYNVIIKKDNVQLDESTMYKTLAGADTYTCALSSYDSTVSVDSTGAIDASVYDILNLVSGQESYYTGDNQLVTTRFKNQTEIFAYRGAQRLSYDPDGNPQVGSYSVGFVAVGCLFTIADNVISVNTISEDKGTIDMTINMENAVTFKQRFTVTRVYDGTDANLLDWVEDWNTNKTEIDDEYIISPKMFSGTKTNGKLTGIAIGRDVITIDGTKRTGIYAIDDDEVVVAIDPITRTYKFKGEIEATSGSFSGKLQTPFSTKWTGLTASVIVLNLEEAFNYTISNAPGSTVKVLLPAYNKYNGVHSIIANWSSSGSGMAYLYYGKGNPNGLPVPWSIPALSMSGTGKYRPKDYEPVAMMDAGVTSIAHVICVPNGYPFVKDPDCYLNIFYSDDATGTNPSLSPVGKSYVAVKEVNFADVADLASGTVASVAFIPYASHLHQYTYRKLVNPSPFDALATDSSEPVPTYVQVRFLDTTNTVTPGSTVSAEANSNLIGVALYLTSRSDAVFTDFIWQDYNRTGKPNVLIKPAEVKRYYRWMAISVREQ